VTLFGYLIYRFLRCYFLVFSLILALIEKIYQLLEAEFYHISKCLEVGQKYSAEHHISTVFVVMGKVVKHSHLCLMF